MMDTIRHHDAAQINSIFLKPPVYLKKRLQHILLDYTYMNYGVNFISSGQAVRDFSDTLGPKHLTSSAIYAYVLKARDMLMPHKEIFLLFWKECAITFS